MNDSPTPPPLPHHSGPPWRRPLAALGLGVFATFAGSGVGAVVLGLFSAAHEGAHALRLIPAFVVYGQFFGPVFAWPVTLLVLPALWLAVPPRLRRRAVLLAGPVSGALAVATRLAAESELEGLGWALVSAGAAGGLAAGLVFAVFARPPASAPPRLP